MQKKPRATWNHVVFLGRDLTGSVGALAGHTLGQQLQFSVYHCKQIVKDYRENVSTVYRRNSEVALISTELYFPKEKKSFSNSPRHLCHLCLSGLSSCLHTCGHCMLHRGDTVWPTSGLVIVQGQAKQRDWGFFYRVNAYILRC